MYLYRRQWEMVTTERVILTVTPSQRIGELHKYLDSKSTISENDVKARIGNEGSCMALGEVFQPRLYVYIEI